MASFEVSHAAQLGSASRAHSYNNTSSASTSYVHFSGHAPRASKSNGASSSRFDGYGVGAIDDEEMMDDGDAALMPDGNNAGDGAGPSRLATTGQAIASSATFMRGHGAYIAAAASRGTHEGEDGTSDGAPVICSSLCGIVRRTNKLVSVASLKTRYAPEVGDLVVGRITDLQPGNRRWKVDIHSRQEANLLLSSINLPGGIQRRKLESDELEMRTFFKEGDLLVCEVQSIFHDGSTSLHTRSLNYGKLRNGQMITVNPCLVRRLKSHFVRLERIGLEILIGLNGVLWVSLLNQGKVNATTGTGRDIEAIYSDVNDAISLQARQRIARMLVVISLLAAHQLPISDVTLSQAFDASVSVAPLQDDDDVDMSDDDDVKAGQMSGEAASSVLDHVRSLMQEHH